MSNDTFYNDYIEDLPTEEEYFQNNKPLFHDPIIPVMRCKCGGVMTVDTRFVLTCYPPKYTARCEKCRHTSYIYC